MSFDYNELLININWIFLILAGECSKVFQCVLIGVSHFTDFVKFGGKCGFLREIMNPFFVKFVEFCGILSDTVDFWGVI